MGGNPYFSRSSSQDDAFNGGPVGIPASAAPWPSFDDPVSYEEAHAPDASGIVGGSYHMKAQDTTLQTIQAQTTHTKRRPSVLRLITGLSRLRRTDTGGTSDASDLASLTALEAHNEDGFGEESSHEPSDEAVEAYVRKNARK